MKTAFEEVRERIEKRRRKQPYGCRPSDLVIEPALYERLYEEGRAMSNWGVSPLPPAPPGTIIFLGVEVSPGRE